MIGPDSIGSGGLGPRRFGTRIIATVRHVRSVFVVIVAFVTITSLLASGIGVLDGTASSDVTDADAASASAAAEWSVGAQTAPAGSAPRDVYGVAQGGECVDVRPITGAESVESYYDYRNPYPNITGNPAASDYSSHGVDGHQAPQTTSMVLYNGPDGDSLVVVHGELDNDASGGSTTTFTFENLPATGSWAVQDDEYPGQDDVWDVTATSTTVTWFWMAARTDGGAYRGIGDASGPITVTGQFNEEAPAWGDTPDSIDPVTEMTTWRVIGADGTTVDLSLDVPVDIVPGGCAALSAPAAALTATPSDTPRDREVSFAATTTGAVPSNAEYAWDFDGDGTIDHVTNTSTTTYSYPAAGTYTASVVVRTTAGSGDPGTATVRVGQSDDPAITVRAVSGDSVVAGADATVDVTVVNDGGGDGEIDIEVVADDETVGSRTVEVDALSTRTVPVTISIAEPGTYDVRVDDAETELEVVEAVREMTVTDVSAPDRIGVDEPTTVTATVENAGNVEATFDVELELFDEVVDTRSVTVEPGESRTVDFEVSISAPGTYTAHVGDASVDLVVTETASSPTTTPEPPGNSEGLPGFTAPLAGLVLGLLVVFARCRT